MGIIVEQAGFLTSVQDSGRFGRQQYGVTVSGAMDVRSLAIVNLLVGNDQGVAALEATMVGPSLRFTSDSVFAVVGADMAPRLNDVPVGLSCAVMAGKGDVLTMSLAKYGCRAYIAFAGGIDLPEVMGSKSTYLRGKFGGFEGRALKKGDALDFGSSGQLPLDISTRSRKPEVFSSTEITLRVVMGPQDTAFTERGIETFLSTPYTITKECDRMGARLDGAVIEHIPDGHHSGNIITDGIAFGSIQVPPSGLPIIMLAERQTTGGYTKIATVTSVDVPLIAQARPGMRIHFQKITVEEAQNLYIQQLKMLVELPDSWRENSAMSGWSVQQIKELMVAMKANNVSGIRINGSQLELDAAAASAKMADPQPMVLAEQTYSEPNTPEVRQNEKLITSPIIGTFYAAPTPDRPPFVSVGSVVKKGDVLCIVESMKLMNEVISDKEGTIAEILVKNEQDVEFGQPLFRFA